MSGDVPIARAMVFLGFIAAFAILLYGNGGPTMPFAPSFPGFHNPFDAQSALQTLYPNGPQLTTSTFYLGTAVGTNNGCADDNTNYWKCLRDYNGTDSNQSYLSLTTPYPDLVFTAYVNFALTGDSGNGHVLQSISTDVWCRSADTTEGLSLDLVTYGDELDDGSGIEHIFANHPISIQSCPLYPEWGRVTIENDVTTQPNSGARHFVLQLGTQKNITGKHLQISTVVTRMLFSDETSCTGGDFFTTLGCQLSSYGTFIVRLGLLGLNIVMWVLGWLAYAGQLIGNFVAVIAWCYAIPGMPLPFQLFIDAYLTGVLGILVLKLISLIRGNQ